MQEENIFYTVEMQREVRDFVANLEKELADYPPLYERDLVQVRREAEEGTGRYVKPVLSDKAIEREIQGEQRTVSVRAFIPEDQIDGVYLHIHGGGWVLGRAHHRDDDLEEIMSECNAAVISVDYRLAPEHPYPAAQDDCESVAMWVIDNAMKEFGTEKVAIGGESAGGHLSASTMIRMRDKHGYTEFTGANLVYGVYDMSGSPSLTLWGDRNLVLSTPTMNWFFDHYLGDEDRKDPDVSPLYAPLHKLAPALFTVGTLDPLLDDTLFMHSRWFASGNPSTLNVYPGATHGFERQPTQLAEKVRSRMRTFISESFQS
ncbi:alpha/beta hydrolase fold domain-containing protein [Chloroflexi bacterium]|nr:alpha/beta hydrolase fold domain-containing protein [Chloroflexota bacterium]